MEKKYEPKNPALDKGMTSTSNVRKRAKANADEILKKHPELKTPVVEEKKETKSKEKK